MTTTTETGGPDLQYQAHLAAGRFMIQRGVKTGNAVFFPRAVAPGTGEDLEWFEPSGRGTVYASTCVRKRPPEADVNISLIDLEEGPRMMARVEGLPADAVPIGLEVQARIIPHEDGHIVVFDARENAR
ncbi:OB-fold domain-containing protein [uncultured Novosphingobium sp.]|uniref:Zn-ribbon domain-containing OB-fold protein n=1 Tax=Novosphingobium fluoreni TaxID=1391222 RepID=UPI0025881388|nr:OB-fold domain-containing protein [uncultured Novosphingobium sp.]